MDYFKERYNLELKYKFLPCLEVGSEQKLIYIPIEVGNYGLNFKCFCSPYRSIYFAHLSKFSFGFQVCKIVPRQRYHKKLEGSQVSTPMKSSISKVHDLPVFWVNLCHM